MLTPADVHHFNNQSFPLENLVEDRQPYSLSNVVDTLLNLSGPSSW